MLIVRPSVVSSTCDSGSIFNRSKIGRSITIAQLLPCFTNFLITFHPRKMVDQCVTIVITLCAGVKTWFWTRISNEHD